MSAKRAVPVTPEMSNLLRTRNKWFRPGQVLAVERTAPLHPPEINDQNHPRAEAFVPHPSSADYLPTNSNQKAGRSDERAHSRVVCFGSRGNHVPSACHPMPWIEQEFVSNR